MEISYYLILTIFGIAIIYSLVGHGGASGYIAAFVLCGLPTIEIRFFALSLNLLVSAIAFWSYYISGHFKSKLLWPFVITSIPAAYLGSLISINFRLLEVLLAIVLVISAIQMILKKRNNNFPEIAKVPLAKAMSYGAFIGFLSGLLGIGGGIILSPILIHLRWANAKNTAATSAAFIFLNSMAGILGQLRNECNYRSDLYILLLAALIGALIGSNIGSNKLSVYKLKIALSLVLIIAAAKLIFK